MSNPMVATESLTARMSTVWLRTSMPRSYSLSAAALVIEVISFGWLMWVWIMTSTCWARAFSTTRVRASVQASSVRNFCGSTASPLVAKRMRRTCGMARNDSPRKVTCSARSWVLSPPEMSTSSTSGRESTYSMADRQRSGSTLKVSLWTSSVSRPTA